MDSSSSSPPTGKHWGGEASASSNSMFRFGGLPAGTDVPKVKVTARQGDNPRAAGAQQPSRIRPGSRPRVTSMNLTGAESAIVSG